MPEPLHKTALSTLKTYWGYDSFRAPQEEIITSILEGRDTFVLMPTGGGKSLCYQIPAVMQEGVALVITPLIALMKDQVAQLMDRGIEARALHSGLYRDEIDDILERALHNRIKLLYLSPERLQSTLFREYLEDLPISLIAIDEAHCISQWGYDFRPSYLDIATVRDYTSAPVLALTGSADPTVVQDIIDKLEFRPEYKVFKKSFVRDKLCYRVKNSSQKTKIISEDYRKGFSSIVYSGTRGNTEKISKRLRLKGIESDYYHAGLSSDQREKKQQNWMHENPPLMVCTNAFGMGIDKPNVRQVFHTQIPPSPEAYYQEAGRAGRDGKFSTATLISSERDLDYLYLQIEKNRFSYTEAQALYDAVHASMGIAYHSGSGQYGSIDEVSIAQKLHFNVYKVLHFLKFFHQEGYWVYKENEWDMRPSIKALHLPSHINNPSSDLQDQVVLSTLYRLYQNIRYKHIKVNTEHIASLSKLSLDSTSRVLDYLQKTGSIDMRKPTEGSSLLLLEDRVPSSELVYNQQKLKTLEKRDKEKADQMKSYVQNTSICRSKMLISFFGEEVDKDCGICDICQQDTGKISKDKLLTFVRSSDNPNIRALQEKFFRNDRSAYLSWIRLGIQLKWWEISSTGSIKLLHN